MKVDEVAKAPASSAPVGRWLEVLAVFFRLGLTSFGGPVAHLGYFRDEFVVRRRWLDDRTYADLVALCQFLPGPASSQVGIAIGLSRAGYPGALAAWTGFTLPSAIALVVFAYGVIAVGALPFWEELRRRTAAQAALRGVNAAVVGLLLAALYTPVWTSGITNAADFALGSAAFLLLLTWKTPPWLVVALSAAGAAALAVF